MFVLFTDFGLAGPYVGQMKLLLNTGAPAAPVVDLFHDVPGYDVKKAACLLARYTLYVPTGAIVVAVVDPGVGTDRQFLKVSSKGRTYFGPDNGLFEYVLREDAAATVTLLDWDEPIASNTFHGRDVFAPMALNHYSGLELAGTQAAPKRFLGWSDDVPEIVYVDHFGNLISGFRSDRVQKDAVFQVAGNPVRFSRTFAEAVGGELFWYGNANGLVEFSVNKGSAAEQYRVGLGDRVTLA